MKDYKDKTYIEFILCEIFIVARLLWDHLRCVIALDILNDEMPNAPIDSKRLFIRFEVSITKCNSFNEPVFLRQDDGLANIIFECHNIILIFFNEFFVKGKDEIKHESHHEYQCCQATSNTLGLILTFDCEANFLAELINWADRAAYARPISLFLSCHKYYLYISHSIN